MAVCTFKARKRNAIVGKALLKYGMWQWFENPIVV
jgi:hypothetical protein